MSKPALLCFAVLSLATACADDAPPAAPAVTPEALRACLTGMVAASYVDSERAVKIVTDGCAAQPGFATYAGLDAAKRTRHLLETTDLACTPAAKTAALARLDERADAYAGLLTTCGATYYGLPTGRDHLFSEEWFILQRVGAWLGRAPASPEKAAVLEAARTLAISWVLPALPGITLPNVSNPSWVKPASLVVFIGSDTTVGTLPTFHVVDGGAVIDDGPFGPLPGTTLPLSQPQRTLLGEQDALYIADRMTPATKLVDAIDALGRPGYLAVGHAEVLPVKLVPAGGEPVEVRDAPIQIAANFLEYAAHRHGARKATLVARKTY